MSTSASPTAYDIPVSSRNVWSGETARGKAPVDIPSDDLSETGLPATVRGWRTQNPIRLALKSRVARPDIEKEMTHRRGLELMTETSPSHVNPTSPLSCVHTKVTHDPRPEIALSTSVINPGIVPQLRSRTTAGMDCMSSTPSQLSALRVGNWSCTDVRPVPKDRASRSPIVPC